MTDISFVLKVVFYRSEAEHEPVREWLRRCVQAAPPSIGFLTPPTLPEFPDIHYREVIVTPYRFFYRVKDSVVWIVAVWDGAQIPEEPADDSANKSPG